MSEQQTTTQSGDLRLAIRSAIADDGAETVGEVITSVKEACHCSETDVIEQVRSLENADLLYRDGSGSDAEVSLP